MGYFCKKICGKELSKIAQSGNILFIISGRVVVQRSDPVQSMLVCLAEHLDFYSRLNLLIPRLETCSFVGDKERIFLVVNVEIFWKTTSVTILGDFLHFGQLYKVCGNNYLAQNKAIYVKVSKSLIFLMKSFLGNFYRHLATFYWSH